MGWWKLVLHGGHFEYVPGGFEYYAGGDSNGDGAVPLKLTDGMFRTSDLPFEERKDFHDEDLKNVSEQINKLLVDVQKKKPDTPLIIMRVPAGLFIRWKTGIYQKCPNPDDNVERKENLEDSEYAYLKLK
jgi:hypothetical protein